MHDLAAWLKLASAFAGLIYLLKGLAKYNLPWGQVARSKAFWITSAVVFAGLHLAMHTTDSTWRRKLERMRDHPSYATAKVIRKNVTYSKNGDAHYYVDFKFKPSEVNYNAYPSLSVDGKSWNAAYLGKEVAMKYDPKDPQYAIPAAEPVTVDDPHSRQDLLGEVFIDVMMLGIGFLCWAGVAAIVRNGKAASATQAAP